MFVLDGDLNFRREAEWRFVENALDEDIQRGQERHRERLHPQQESARFLPNERVADNAWTLESFRSEEQGVVATDSDITSRSN